MRKLIRVVRWWAVAGLMSAGAAGSGAPEPNKCVMTAEERVWINGALQASDYIIEQRLHLSAEPRPRIIVFNDHCRFELREGSNEWSGEAHAGKIRLLKGAIDAGVTSMADYDEKTGQRFFAMSLPSVWEAAKLMSPGDTGLTAVFLHEYSHARHAPALRQLFQAATSKYKLPDYFNDDSLQDHFKSDPAYVAVYEKEAALLYEAAAEPDAVKARHLAKQALDLMEARQKRWFTGTDAMWKPYDDLFLTMEGFGQWTAYAWLSDPKGVGMTTDAAREKMRGKRRWWSQEEGLGLFLVIDRFVPNWAEQAFGSPPALGIDLLRQVAAGAPDPAKK